MNKIFVIHIIKNLLVGYTSLPAAVTAGRVGPLDGLRLRRHVADIGIYSKKYLRCVGDRYGYIETTFYTVDYYTAGSVSRQDEAISVF